MVVGLRGHTHGGLLWDVSGSFGQNAVDFFIDNTVNASLGPQSPASFDPGVYMQREIGANLDLNYTVNDMVNVAGGAEFRDEYFEIGIGETTSWEIGPFAPQGFSAGSNGFPGFSDPAEAERLIAEGITSAKNLANFRFFTNDFNTRTRGVDVVASFAPAGMGGDTEFSLAINHTATTVTSYNPAVLDEVRIRQLEDALPGTRWTTSGRRAWGDLSLLGRLSYYAGWFDSRDDRDYPGEFLVDLEATYAVSESAKITVGSQNALNQYPEENPNAATVAGNRYSPATPFGASGGFVYVKMGFNW